MAIVLQPNARDDLREIWRFGAERWSIVMADAYLDMLFTAIDRLVENPASGARIDPGASPYRRLVVGSHSLFYRQDEDDILIVRILQSKADMARHLDLPRTAD